MSAAVARDDVAARRAEVATVVASRTIGARLRSSGVVDHGQCTREHAVSRRPDEDVVHVDCGRPERVEDRVPVPLGAGPNASLRGVGGLQLLIAVRDGRRQLVLDLHAEDLEATLPPRARERARVEGHLAPAGRDVPGVDVRVPDLHSREVRDVGGQLAHHAHLHVRDRRATVAALVDLAVPVVVAAVAADLVAGRRSGVAPATAAHVALVDLPVAVVVDAVARLGRPGVNRETRVVAVARHQHAARAAGADGHRRTGAVEVAVVVDVHRHAVGLRPVRRPCAARGGVVAGVVDAGRGAADAEDGRDEHENREGQELVHD